MNQIYEFYNYIVPHLTRKKKKTCEKEFICLVSHLTMDIPSLLSSLNIPRSSINIYSQYIYIYIYIPHRPLQKERGWLERWVDDSHPLNHKPDPTLFLPPWTSHSSSVSPPPHPPINP
jgi:hypothetical protein